MGALTKTAIIATGLSVTILFLTDVTQSLQFDRKQILCIVSWHIPFYGSVQMPEWTWWIFTRIWLLCLLVPPILWLAVGIRKLVQKSA